jgi:hypothetical protein
MTSSTGDTEEAKWFAACCFTDSDLPTASLWALDEPELEPELDDDDALDDVVDTEDEAAVTVEEVEALVEDDAASAAESPLGFRFVGHVFLRRILRTKSYWPRTKLG